MVFLFKKKSRGKQYYYIGENKKVKGKSVRAWEEYIGSVEKILELKRKDKEDSKVEEVKDFEFGISAAMIDLCNQLELMKIVNQYTDKKRDQGVDVGSMLMLMVINHCVDSLSKRKLEMWYKKSILRRYTGISVKGVKSQRLWDHMNYFTPKIIDQIEIALNKRLVSKFNVQFDCLLYDPTNFSTYIKPHRQQEIELPQWGHPKSGKKGLLQVNLALLVTKEDGIPLMHQVYCGNVNDITEFKAFLPYFINRFKLINSENSDLTLIFDKGNNSKDAFSLLEDMQYHFVGSLRPSTQKKLLSLPLEEFEETWIDDKKRKTKAHRTHAKIYDVEHTLVMTWHEPSAKTSSHTLEKHISDAEVKLQTLQSKIGLKKYDTATAIEKMAQKIISKKKIKGLIYFQIETQDASLESPLISLTWQRNLENIVKKKATFGRSVLFTDRNDWSTREIVKAYRSQWRVERDFQEMKNPFGIQADPARHWTDSHLRVHYFICILALLLQRLLHRRIKKAGLDWSLDRLMESLGNIKEYVVWLSKTSTPQYKLSKLSSDQKKLFTILELNKYSKESSDFTLKEL